MPNGNMYIYAYQSLSSILYTDLALRLCDCFFFFHTVVAHDLQISSQEEKCLYYIRCIVSDINIVTRFV